MEKAERFEHYPVSTICVSNLVSVGIYASGLFITLQAGWYFSLAFLLFIFASEYRLIRHHCTKCIKQDTFQSQTQTYTKRKDVN